MSLALLLSVALAAAESPVHLTGEVGTDFPVDLGGRATLELPGRLRLTGGIGWMPRGYVKVINTTVVALGGYDESTAALIEDALSSSLVVHAHGGWRPFRRAGLYLDGGYGLITLGGTVQGAEVVSMALGMSVPGWLLEGNDFAVHSSLHLIEAEAGWEGHPWKGLTWRLALAGIWTVDARTEVTPTFDPWLIESLVDDWCDTSGGKLDATYERWVRSPTVVVGVGWRGF